MNVCARRVTTPPLNISNEVIDFVECYKDLGVIADSSLKYRQHISTLTAKARQKIDLLFKCLVTRDAQILTKAFVYYRVAQKSKLLYCDRYFNG